MSDVSRELHLAELFVLISAAFSSSCFQVV